MADGCSDGRMRPLVKASGSHDERVTPHFPATLEVEMGGFDWGGCSPDEGEARRYRGSPPPRANLGVNLGADMMRYKRNSSQILL